MKEIKIKKIFDVILMSIWIIMYTFFCIAGIVIAVVHLDYTEEELLEYWGCFLSWVLFILILPCFYLIRHFHYKYKFLDLEICCNMGGDQPELNNQQKDDPKPPNTL